MPSRSTKKAISKPAAGLSKSTGSTKSTGGSKGPKGGTKRARRTAKGRDKPAGPTKAGSAKAGSAKPRVDDDSTRQRLLETAGEVFALRGFREATVREICGRAGANVAAVNYHFGDKQGLYGAALEYAHRCSVERHPSVDEGDTPPDEQLRAYVHAFMARVFDHGRPAWLGKLMMREMAEPTAAMDQLIERGIRPQWEQLLRILRALAGPTVSERELSSAGFSVIGQVTLYFHAEAVVERLEPDRERSLSKIAEHITRFTLAGMETMRAAGEQGEADKGAGVRR